MVNFKIYYVTTCNTIQCNTMQNNAIQCNTMQYNTMQYNAIQLAKQLQYTYCPISYKVKATRQWNLVS